MLDQEVNYCGSCWAHTTAEQAGDRMYIASNGTFNQIMSPQAIMDCDHSAYPGKTPSGWAQDDACNGGYLELSTEFVVTHGVTPLTCRAYDYEHSTCNATCDDRTTERPLYRATKRSWVPGEQAMMEEIYEHGSISAIMVWYEDFAYYQSGIYQHVYGVDWGGHAVLLIGWGEENGVKYWIVRNSEGPSWGENGYFRIIRGVNCARMEEDAWAMYFNMSAYLPGAYPAQASPRPSWEYGACSVDQGALEGFLFDVKAGISAYCPVVDWPVCTINTPAMGDYNVYLVLNEMFAQDTQPTAECLSATTRYLCANNFQRVLTPTAAGPVALPPCRRLCREWADNCATSGTFASCSGLPDDPDVDCTMVGELPALPTQFGTDGRCPLTPLNLSLPANRAKLGICGYEETLPSWELSCVQSVDDQAKFAANALNDWLSPDSYALVDASKASSVCLHSLQRQACARAFPAVAADEEEPSANPYVLPTCYSTCMQALERCGIAAERSYFCHQFYQNADGACTGYKSELPIPTPSATPVHSAAPALRASVSVAIIAVVSLVLLA